MHQMPGGYAPVNPAVLAFVALAACAAVAVANQNGLVPPLTLEATPSWAWVAQSARQIDRSLTAYEVAQVGRAFPADMPLDAQGVAAAARAFRGWKERSEASAAPAGGSSASPSDLLKVARDALTGETIEWWRVGGQADARARDLRGIHGKALQCSTGRYPHVEAWFGPAGEQVVASRAVTLRYRPTGAGAAPGARPIAVLRAKARGEAVYGGAS